jgi:hypothetical protein
VTVSGKRSEGVWALSPAQKALNFLISHHRCQKASNDLPKVHEKYSSILLMQVVVWVSLYPLPLDFP